MNASAIIQRTLFRGASTLLVGAAAVTLPLIPSALAQQKTIKVDGSSTVYPIAEVAASGFQKANSSIKVTVGISGTGGGFKKFCAGELDISNASRPILKKEMDACKNKGIKYIELPIAFDGIAVVVHPQNNWAKDLTVAELKKIWEPGSKVKNWSQVRKGFPNVPIKLFGPGPDSGTFDYFTEAVNGKAKASRTDYTPSEDDNVLVQGVAGDRGSLGYFGKSYLEANKSRIKPVAIVSPSGSAVLPSDQTVQNGTYQPLSRPLFIYIRVDAAKRPEVKQFVSYFINNGAAITKKAKYTALPGASYPKILANFNKGKAGTVFNGQNDIGATIAEVLDREGVD
ncbi:PstS family phosphate ABC transporter substrate-binding protein [Pseudanabaena sp. PCC 6802]|uniref:PstS family phosphate ABC transporter substrate-binding protein n=1 Tax=Pseudanabaena sp. PCC 6802 TaxID=118173 RepID=UPI00034AA4D2|nr:PstS family phosphate ABC transporter substrate-binding protein [Pseudanabaena sp. PCC 6802]